MVGVKHHMESEFELKNRRNIARVGILLSRKLTLDVFCTYESLTSQCKWHMYFPCALKSLHHGFLTPGEVVYNVYND